MLRDLLEKPLLKRARTCESCGTEFNCEIGLKGCWCTQISLTDEQRSNLSTQFSDCLCRQCLGKISDQTRAETQV